MTKIRRKYKMTIRIIQTSNCGDQQPFPNNNKLGIFLTLKKSSNFLVKCF